VWGAPEGGWSTAGFKIDKVVANEGISGVSTRLAERPEGKRLFDMLRAGDRLVVRWVDRLAVTTSR
jgi:putative DNA-invertase from lambdoid prophage Rac